MADINKLKDQIKSTIYPNGKGAINASDHQALLLDMAAGMAETDTKVTELSAEVIGQYKEVNYDVVGTQVLEYAFNVKAGDVVYYTTTEGASYGVFLFVLQGKTKVQEIIAYSEVTKKEFAINFDGELYVRVDGGNTKPLKVIVEGVAGEIRRIESKIQAVNNLVSAPIVSTLMNWRYSINAEGWINEGFSVLFDIEGRSEWVGKTERPTYYAYLNSFDFDNMEGVFNESTPIPSSWAPNKELHVAIPSDAKYLWVQLGSGFDSPDVIPEYLIVDGIDCVFDGSPRPVGNLPAKIDENAKKIDENTKKIEQLSEEVSGLSEKIVGQYKEVNYDVVGTQVLEYAFDVKAGDVVYYTTTEGASYGVFLFVLQGKTKVQEIIAYSEVTKKEFAINFDGELYVRVDGGNTKPLKVIVEGVAGEIRRIEQLIEQLNVAVPKFLDFSDVIVCSHRGNSAISCPENSLHSITNAAFQQMKIVECDVQFTSDGVPVVLHDGTLNRTMNTINDEELSEDVRVSDITWDELSKGYIYKTSVEKYKTRICTFWEWMDRVKQLKLIPFLHWIDASLIGRVQQYVGDHFIYMGPLKNCKEVRKLAPNCFIMYQQASQQTSTGELTDIDAVITDMHAIGGLCGYSSMAYATFTDEFVDKLRKNGYYWQFSTDVPSYSTECIRRGVDFLLINNWCNNHLTYKPLFKVADDLSNIIYTSLENGCPVLEQDASILLSLAIKGNNVRLHIVCKGQVQVIVDGKVSRFGNDEYFAAYECGVNTISTEIGVTIYARSRVVIEELYIEES